MTTLMRGGCDMSLIGPNLNNDNCEDAFIRKYGTQLSAELGRSILGAEIELRLYPFQCPDTVRLCSSLFLSFSFLNIKFNTWSRPPSHLCTHDVYTAGNPR